MSKHSHYHKDVSHLQTIDVYAVCQLFAVEDPSGATQHAIKKLLCGGQRGVKSQRQDMQEAVDTLVRRIQMIDEAAGWTLEAIKAASLDPLACSGCASGCFRCRSAEPASQIDDASPRDLEFCRHCGAGTPFPHKPGCPRVVTAA